jgi:hypothetical protein
MTRGGTNGSSWMCALSLLLSWPGFISAAGAAVGPSAGAPSLQAARLSDDVSKTKGTGEDKTSNAVAFVICDERTGETGRVVNIQWVGRVDERKKRCD